MYNIPILVIVFNRPDLAIGLKDLLAKIKPRLLYVAADGPRDGNDRDLMLCRETREVFSELPWDCEVKYLYSEKNKGCGLAVSTAIDWFFNNEEMGVILEDDCRPNLSFFTFVETLLTRYKDNPTIYSINGFNPNGIDKIKESYGYISYNLMWGWATWRRAWKEYSYNVETDDQIKTVLRKYFKSDFISRRSWLKHLQQVRAGKIDTWDYQWLYTGWKNNALHIIPKNNLVSNVGFREDGTHYSADDKYSKIEATELLFPLTFNDQFKISGVINSTITKERFGNYWLYFIKPILRKYLSI
ncbi:nucleotide-diphospho-sugar transferase [Nubsella zeaxanthinifaciens]|uniref:nucleotide-diphospho-sugar transferase n=1 Tax=Nubsella zeaxanthinifaciens TaxID=392412 RepID=UPI000DE24221|nr:nucleotide-diphospho-sugar transferase [Nubsella zeaxanthinifaciens]